MNRVKIIGAGLAGSECAWQLARRRVPVELYEMRPVRTTPAHQTSELAELVCSNSLKSESENTAPWLLKEEMRRAGSLLLEIARECAVPAGHALAVDRVQFSAQVTEAISREPLIQVFRDEVTAINALTSLSVQSVKIPIHFKTDREVIDRALDSLALKDRASAKVMRIRDTLTLDKLQVSESFLKNSPKPSRLSVLSDSQEMTFDHEGNLLPLG